MENFFLSFLKIFFPECQAITISFANPLATRDFREFVENIINVIFTVALPLAVVMLVVGGILIVTASGNQSQIENGKKFLIYTLVGVVILLSAKGLVNLLEYLVR